MCLEGRKDAGKGPALGLAKGTMFTEESRMPGLPPCALKTSAGQARSQDLISFGSLAFWKEPKKELGW